MDHTYRVNSVGSLRFFQKLTMYWPLLAITALLLARNPSQSSDMEQIQADNGSRIFGELTPLGD